MFKFLRTGFNVCKASQFSSCWMAPWHENMQDRWHQRSCTAESNWSFKTILRYSSTAIVTARAHARRAADQTDVHYRLQQLSASNSISVTLLRDNDRCICSRLRSLGLNLSCCSICKLVVHISLLAVPGATKRAMASYRAAVPGRLPTQPLLHLQQTTKPGLACCS